jgi:hypothetical protein
MLPYLLPLPSLWSPCLLLVTGVERMIRPDYCKRKLNHIIIIIVIIIVI